MNDLLTRELIASWRDGAWALVIDPPADSKAKRTFAGINHNMSDDFVRERIASGWIPVSSEEGVDIMLLELQGHEFMLGPALHARRSSLLGLSSE